MHKTTFLLATCSLLLWPKLATAVVTITPADPASVKQGIMEAYNTNQDFVSIPQGTYYIPYDGTTPPWHLYFKNMSRAFEIRAENATFVFMDRGRRSIAFENCSNLVFKGGTFIRHTNPFSQGTIVNIATDKTYVDIKIHAGYPTDIVDSPHFSPIPGLTIFESSSRQLKPNIPFIYTKKVESLGGSTYRFHCKTPISTAIPLAVNDLAAWRGTVLCDFNLRLCRNMKIDGLRFLGAAGFCVAETLGDGGNSFTYTLTYPPLPPGATEAPLISSNADGFNSGAVRQGPALTNCLIEGTDDDGFAIHGLYTLVMEPNVGATVVIDSLDTLGRPPCAIGDTMRFYDTQGRYADSATVTGITKLTDYTAPSIPANFRLFAQTTPICYRLTLDKTVPAQTFWQAANVNQMSNGFSMTNCVIRDTMGHGILLKSGGGTIRNCSVINTVKGGLVVAPEIEAWAEADYARDLIVSENFFSRCGLGRQFWTGGALTVAAYAFGKFVPLPGGHQNITISRNLFRNTDGPNVLLSSSNTVRFSDNIFLNPMRALTYNENVGLGVEQSALVWLTESSNVSFANNRIGNAGANLTYPIKGTSTASGVGFTDGIGHHSNIVANFDSGGGNAIDAYPGVAGAKWKDGWKVIANLATATGSASNIAPIAAQEGNCLVTSIQTSASVGAGAAFYRRLDGTGTGVDMSKRHQFYFDLRIDKANANMRYSVFNRLGSASISTDANCTWMIIGTASGWQFLNGNKAGGGVWLPPVNGSAQLSEGGVYHFVIDVHPVTKTWSATIRTGTKVLVSPLLGFRANSAIDGEFLEFGVCSASANTANTYGFSLDNVSILQTP